MILRVDRWLAELPLPSHPDPRRARNARRVVAAALAAGALVAVGCGGDGGNGGTVTGGDFVQSTTNGTTSTYPHSSGVPTTTSTVPSEQPDGSSTVPDAPLRPDDGSSGPG